MLTRNKSVNKIKVGASQSSDNMNACLSQKDKIITLLQGELQEYRKLHEKYARLSDKKNTVLDKCDILCQ